MSFEQVIPVLPARDVAATVAFYRDKLEFTDGFVYGNGEYGGVSQGTLALHFWRCEDAVVLETCSCRVRVSDVEAFYEHCRAQGAVHPNGSLEAKPWGMLEFAVLDVSGNLIWFYEPRPLENLLR